MSLSLAGSVRSCACQAAMVISVLAMPWAMAETLPSTVYRSEGLVAHWDAIDNAVDEGGSRSHDATAKVWKDLSGNGVDLTVSNGTWGDSALVLQNGRAYRSGNLANVVTMEVCLKTQAKQKDWNGGMTFSSSPKRYVFFQTDKFIMVDDNGKTGVGYSSATSLLSTNATFQYVYNGVSSMGYFNGLANYGTYADFWGINNAEVNIGNRTSGNGNATVHAIRIYSSVLSETELAQHQAYDDIRFFGGELVSPVAGATALGTAADTSLALVVGSASWHLGSDAASRKIYVDYRKKGMTDWQSVCLAGPFQSVEQNVAVVVPGLDPETQYEVRARLTCTFGGTVSREAVGETAEYATTAPNPAPDFNVNAAGVALGASDLEIPVQVISLGYGADGISSASLSVGSAEGVYDYTEEIDPQLFVPGGVAVPLRRFAFDTVRYARLRVTNDRGESAERTFSFVVQKETYGSCRRPGLWQVKFTSGKGSLAELTTNPSAFDIMAQPEGANPTERQVVEGMILAYAPYSNPVITSAFTGRTYAVGDQSTWGYWGYMYFVAGKTYVFGGDYYDASRFYVGTSQIMYQGLYGSFSSGSYVPQTTGWQPIRGYLGHTQSGAGCKDKGFVWNDEGLTSSSASGWRQMLDSEAAYLTCGWQDGATNSVVAIDRLYRVGSRLVAKVRLTDGLMGAGRFYARANASYGSNAVQPDAGDVRLETADGKTAICDMAVPSGVNHIRFAAVVECLGATGTCWAASVDWNTLPETADVPPMLVAADVDPHNAADDVAVCGKVFSVGQSATVTVTVDGVAKAGSVGADGSFSVGFSGLDEAVAHTASVVVTDSNGSDSLDLEDFTFSRENSFDSSLKASVLSDKPRNVTFTANVASLGVGETYAVFYVGTRKDALAEAARIKLTDAGYVSYSVTDRIWGETLYGKVVFETTFKGETATSTTSVASKEVVDDAIYTWKASVSEGNWGDPSNWDSNKADCIGCPSNASSHVVFAGSNVRVKVNGRYSTYVVTFGANDLTLWSADTNACSLTIADNYHLEQDRSLTFDHVVFTSAYFVRCAAGSRLVVTNGAAVAFASGNRGIEAGSSARVVVAGGARLTVPCVELSSGSTLVVDDATVVVKSSMPMSGATVEFRGANPRLDLLKANPSCTSGGDSSTFLFDLPPTGFARPPIVGTGKTSAFGVNGSLGWLQLSLTGEEASRSLRYQPLIVWDGGVATSNVVPGTVALKDCGFAYSEKTSPSYRPWSKSPDGLDVRTVGMHGIRLGLAILVR